MRIAQRFNAGARELSRIPVLEGRLNFSRPSGTSATCSLRNPSVETLGYSRYVPPGR